MDSFDFYRVYKPIKLHFTQLKFNMFEKKTRCTETEFRGLNFSSQIAKISSMVNNRKEAGRICVSNFAAKEFWLTDSNKTIIDRSNLWLEYRKNPENVFIHDLESIKKTTGVPGIEKLVSPTKSGVLPPVLQLFIEEKVSADFVCSLDLACPFIEDQEDFWFVESGSKLRLIKNRSFLKLEKVTAKKLLSSIF